MEVKFIYTYVMNIFTFTYVFSFELTCKLYKSFHIHLCVSWILTMYRPCKWIRVCKILELSCSLCPYHCHQHGKWWAPSELTHSSIFSLLFSSFYVFRLQRNKVPPPSLAFLFSRCKCKGHYCEWWLEKCNLFVDNCICAFTRALISSHSWSCFLSMCSIVHNVNPKAPNTPCLVMFMVVIVMVLIFSLLSCCGFFLSLLVLPCANNSNWMWECVFTLFQSHQLISISYLV